MKKTWFLILPIILLASACSLTKKTEPIVNNYPVLNASSTTCVIPVASSTLVATSTIVSKNILPPVSREELKKTFTYEDEETGVKLKYPGACYFNKGVFQCSDFTLSIWIMDSASTKQSTVPEKTIKDKQTQLKYTFIHNNKVYALMAWYDGQNRVDLEKMIDKIAKSLTFTR